MRSFTPAPSRLVGLTVRRGDRIGLSVTDTTGLSSSVVESGCDGRNAPKVGLECPADLLWGEPATFVAIASDADGDTPVFVWTINGVVVDGAASAELRAVTRSGDVVAVTATDPTGRSGEASVSKCGRTTRPVAAITCPATLVFGEPAVFTATATDPDGGESFTYLWMVNGQPIDDASTSTLRTTVARGDVVSVSVTDVDGAVSTTVAADCAGTARPVVELSCPTKLVYGEAVELRATATDHDGETFVFEWRVNGEVVADATSGAATLTLQRGDRVSVTARDAQGLVSAEATSDCSGTTRPTVAVACPTTFVPGEPTRLTATGRDGDGDSLSYRWSVNGTPVASATGPTATLTLAADDVVTVVGPRPHGTRVAASNVRLRPDAAAHRVALLPHGLPQRRAQRLLGSGFGRRRDRPRALHLGRQRRAPTGTEPVRGVAAHLGGRHGQRERHHCGGSDVVDGLGQLLKPAQRRSPRRRAVRFRRPLGCWGNAVQTAVTGASLPVTGGDAGPLALTGLSVVALGALLVVAGRRRRT